LPTAQDFQIALKELFRNAGGQYVDINSGELHRKVGVGALGTISGHLPVVKSCITT
jgi:hypothetical protein